MKRSAYFYTFLLLGMLALIVFGFIYYLEMMIGLIVFSSVVSFVVFLVDTRVKSSIADEASRDEPIDFYKAGTRTTYYEIGQRKQANAD